MSFLPIDQQKEADAATQQQTTNFPAGEAPPTSGGSVGTESGGPAAKTSATGTPTQFGSSASKLGDYLSANAPQITNQANTITGNLNQQYGQLQSGISNAANQFGQQVQGGYTAPNKDVVNQAVANPTQFTADPNNIKAFQAQYNNAYTGPQNFESTQPYGEIQGNINNAVQQANLLGTQSGLQSYLSGKQKNPTQASATLDALLLQGNPEAQQKIQQAAGQFKGLTDQFGQATQGANSSVQAAQKAAQDAQAYAQGQYGTAVTGFNTGLTDKLNATAADRTKYNTDINTLRSQLQSGDLSGATGVNPALQDFMTNQLNPWTAANAPNSPFTYNYVDALPSNINPQVPQLGQVANQQDYATLAALAQLGGSPITSPLSADTASQAGTYQAPAIGNVDNQKIAQAMLNGWQGGGDVRVGANPFQQYLAYQNSLQNYLGQNVGANKPGPGTPIPTITPYNP